MILRAHAPRRNAHVQWESELSEKFRAQARGTTSADERHFLSATASNRSVLFVSHKLRVLGIDCYTVRRELSDYLEGDLTPQLRLQIEDHLENCDRCTAVYDGIRNVMQLVADEKAIELPTGFSRRLYRRLFRIQ
jgi:putative zinc finger protein